ncbi:MAG: DUF6933 domain-containing protein [Burkholderiales bacterium]
MALIHCTRKLAQKLSGVSAAPIAETGALGSWHASLIRFDRRQCVLFCHDATRYCLFLPGVRAPQLAELGRWHRELFLASLAKEGVADPVVARAGIALGPARYDAKTDRSVLATMNVAQWDLGAYVSREDHVMDVDALLASRRLNERPVRANGKSLWPARAICEQVARLAPA